jgi:hypothetical protein
MDSNKIASELVKIDKVLVALDFETKEEMNKYKKEHDVRPGTKLKVVKNKKLYDGKNYVTKEEDKSNKEQEDDKAHNRTPFGHHAHKFIKTIFNHSDSFPEKIGADVIEHIKKNKDKFGWNDKEIDYLNKNLGAIATHAKKNGFLESQGPRKGYKIHGPDESTQSDNQKRYIEKNMI